jgi:hypothetical protein
MGRVTGYVTSSHGAATPLRYDVTGHLAEQADRVGSARRGGAVPSHNVPCRSLHNGRAGLQRIEHALHLRRHGLDRAEIKSLFG